MPDVALDLRYLRCAIAAAEHGSFRRTALFLDVPQSTVSRRIQMLEGRLGFPLFVRERIGVKLTPAGANFLKDAIAGVHHLSRAAQLAAATHRGERGIIRVGILASLTSGFLRRVLTEFRERNQGLQVVLHEGTPLETLNGLAMGRLDVSFLTGEHDLRGHNSKVLWHESIYAVLPSAHPLSHQRLIEWEDLRSENFITSHGGPGSEIQDYLIRRLAQPGFRPRIEVHDVSRENLLSLVAMGYGVTLTSTSSLRMGVDGVAFMPIAGEQDTLPSSVVWPKGDLNPALQRLIALAEVRARSAVTIKPASSSLGDTLRARCCADA